MREAYAGRLPAAPRVSLALTRATGLFVREKTEPA